MQLAAHKAFVHFVGETFVRILPLDEWNKIGLCLASYAAICRCYNNTRPLHQLPGLKLGNMYVLQGKTHYYPEHPDH